MDAAAFAGRLLVGTRTEGSGMRTVTVFVVGMGLGALLCASAQARPTPHRGKSAANLSNRSFDVARKGAAPNFTVDLRAANAVDLSVRDCLLYTSPSPRDS